MKKSSPQYKTVGEYLDTISTDLRTRLEKIAEVVRQAAPSAENRISYNMPAFFYKGRLVYFCAFKNHIGFYPASMTVFEEFKNELGKFKQSGRGTIQFQNHEALPVGLIRKIVEFRVKENEKKES